MQAVQEKENEMITYEEAAQILGLTVNAIRSAVMKGYLRSVKVAGQRAKYVYRSEVVRYGKLPAKMAIAQAPAANVDTERLQFVRDMSDRARDDVLAVVRAGLEEGISGVLSSRLLMTQAALTATSADPSDATPAPDMQQVKQQVQAARQEMMGMVMGFVDDCMPIMEGIVARDGIVLSDDIGALQDSFLRALAPFSPTMQQVALEAIQRASDAAIADMQREGRYITTVPKTEQEQE